MDEYIAFFSIIFYEFEGDLKMLTDVGVGLVRDCQVQMLNMGWEGKRILGKGADGSDIHFLQLICIVNEMLSADVECVFGE